MNKIDFIIDNKLFLTAAFSFVALTILLLITIWINSLSQNAKNFSAFYNEHQTSEHLTTMLESARQRIILLHRMAMIDDEFDRDDLYMVFKEHAGHFIAARDELLARSEKFRTIWRKAQPDIREGEIVQQKIVELILDDEISQANKILLESAIPTQNSVIQTLSEMFDIQNEIAHREYNSAATRNSKTIELVMWIGGIVLLVTIATAVYVIRRCILTEFQLYKAQKNAEAANIQKSQFLANMSHEIRSPLTTVLGFADSLLMPDLDKSQYYDFVTRIMDSGEHLLSVINDVLDFSKIEANQLSIEIIEVNIPKLLLGIDNLMHDRASAKGVNFAVNFNFPLPDIIQTDPTRLKQILMNLCCNAIEFTQDGQVSIDIYYDKDSDELTFAVVDTGIGISEEHQKKLFNAFSQVDATVTRHHGGTGLGLSISKRLCELLGGQIRCESVVGEGSKFTFTIPANCSNNMALVDEYSAEIFQRTIDIKNEIPALQGNILLAEDSIDNQHLISLFVRNTGADITIVESGKMAVEHALAKNYNLILMDMQMPEMSGSEAVEWLRELGNETPIAMLTANAMRQEREHCLALGANEFLAKPINKQHFYAVLQKYLNRASVAEQPKAKDEDFGELVEVFLSLLPEHLEHLQVFLKNENWEEIRKIAHKLKGSGGSFGFPEISKKSYDVEKRIKSGDLYSAKASLDNLFDCIAKLLKQQSGNDGARKCN